MRTSTLTVSVGLMAGLALMGLGCNPIASVKNKVAEGVTEKVLENAGGGKFDVDLKGVNGDEGGITIRDNKTGDFYITGSNVTIPDDFPKDVPKYDGAKTIAVSYEKKTNGGFFIQQTNDDVAKVAEWYKSQLKSAGFSNDNDMDAGETKILGFKKDKVTISVTITRDSEKNETTIQASRQEEQAGE